MSEDVMAAACAEGARPLWASQSWLQSDALDALAAVNEQCLELLCEQAAARTPARPRPALLKELEALWYGLDAGARRRAARCPFLLVDASLPGRPAARGLPPEAFAIRTGARRRRRSSPCLGRSR